MGKNGAIGREQLAPAGHESGALADAEIFEELFHILDLVAGDFKNLLLRLEAEADPLLSLCMQI